MLHGGQVVRAYVELRDGVLTVTVCRLATSARLSVFNLRVHANALGAVAAMDIDAPFDYRQAAVARCATSSGMSRVPDSASSATLSAKHEQNAATPAGGTSLLAAILARQVSFAPADTDARDR